MPAGVSGFISFHLMRSIKFYNLRSELFHICSKANISLLTSNMVGVAKRLRPRIVVPVFVDSNPITHPRKKALAIASAFFQLNPPLRVGEILLYNVKSSLRSGEIAAAVGGFNFTWCDSIKFHFDEVEISPWAKANDFTKSNNCVKVRIHRQNCRKYLFSGAGDIGIRTLTC